MKNGRENRTNGNEEEGEKEKEALRKFSTKSKRGTHNASPKFLGASDPRYRTIQLDGFEEVRVRLGIFFSFAGHKLR
jgi:hypothetical protein